MLQASRYDDNRKDNPEALHISLMKNFQNLGYFEDYEDCYSQYMREHVNLTV